MSTGRHRQPRSLKARLALEAEEEARYNVRHNLTINDLPAEVRLCRKERGLGT